MDSLSLDQLVKFLPPPLHDPTRQAKIDQIARIPKPHLQASIYATFAVASISVLFRVGVRLQARKSFSLDDYCVVIAASAMCAATGLLLQNMDTFYLVEAIFKLYLIPTKSEIGPILEVMKLLHIIVPLLWLTVFAIKFAFLSFFHTLTAHYSKRIVQYFWAVVAFVVLSWLSSSLSMVILCPYSGMQSIRCQPTFETNNNNNRVRTVVFSCLFAALDIVSDIFIISIPIAILGSSMMPTSQKLGILAMLCLSIVMVVMAVVRIVGTVSSNALSVTVVWTIFWFLLEGYTAVMMASVIVIRSVFIKKHYSPGQSRRGRNVWFHVRMPTWWRSGNDKEVTESSGDSSVRTKGKFWLPSLVLTRATLNGLRSSSESRTTNAQTLHSVDTENDMESVLEYHEMVQRL